ncbi:ABC transporter ATP-binding protein [Paenibacillus sp. LHD-38]|uniref:ABC transporter ATP-binding protein n=1 Tax=Paenibacillus sp. LHD-38 TaxID=3072143 RepID=UPI00280E37AC|nr:ABC transporter ATP-binding protein [Paenibacillus sp. LHD-38]MDQ8733272.1 ABC transporter ATP-binding protein [Paenibacillus sp. LHD-38]
MYQIELKQITVTPPTLLDGQMLQPIVKDVSLSIRQGEWISLLGRNGSGKSTVAKVAAGYRIAGVTGQVLRSIETAALGKPIPIVMQQPEAAMIGATPWEDVVLMLEQNGLETLDIPYEAECALRNVGMGERLHQPIETFSGGQKQLVAIAGCLAAKTPILVLDEVTAMLDPESASSVLEQVRSLQQSGVTVIWITQKLEELRPGDRIIAMDEGTILFDGQAESWFVRSKAGVNDSLCEKHGFEAPYAAQVAWELDTQGVRLRPFPFTANMLAEAVKRYEI